jgi:hypothetical protein
LSGRLQIDGHWIVDKLNEKNVHFPK